MISHCESRPQRYLLFLPAAESHTALAIVLIIRDYISVTRTVQRYLYMYIYICARSAVTIYLFYVWYVNGIIDVMGLNLMHSYNNILLCCCFLNNQLVFILDLFSNVFFKKQRERPFFKRKRRPFCTVTPKLKWIKKLVFKIKFYVI